MRRKRFRLGISGVFLLAVPVLLWAAEQARVGQATELRAAPHADAAPVTQLASGTVVEVIQRKAGWYQIRSGNAEGWVRMTRLQFGEPSAQAGPNDALAFLSSGRSTATEATASTGIRGLDEPQLAEATPDMAAVGRLEQFAAAEIDARKFATEAPVVTTSVQDLPRQK